MIKHLSIFAVALIMALHVTGQDLNSYKYVVVPAQFSFQKEPGQYKVNNLTKFLFEKYGFNAYLSSEVLPPDLNANGCNTLYMAADAGGFLGTHLTYTLANCRGEIVYTSPEGKSKIKEYEGAYNEVMREAMKGLEEEGYTYSDEVIPIENTVATKGKMQNNNATMHQNQVNQASKQVVVSGVPEKNGTQNNRSTNRQPVENRMKKEQKTISGGNEEERVIASTESNTEVKSYNTYKSTDGSYMLKRTDKGFDVYEGENKIGEAKKTSSGSYLINTSEFTGVGSMTGNSFVVEREIKGVQGLVKMEFEGVE